MTEVFPINPQVVRTPCRTLSIDKSTSQSTAASIWQVVNTIPPFCGVLFLMYVLFPVSYLLVLALAVIAAGFLIRIFIIQHDCGHGSFLRSRRANDRLGRVCSLFTMISYDYWRRQHALHHTTSGNLDRRGYGDMDIYTVDEYLHLSRWQRFCYRAYRNPLVFLLFGPMVAVLYQNRIPFDKKQTTRRQRRNVHITTLTAVAIFTTLGLWIGFGKLFLIAGPVLQFGYAGGIWLFYIQHQFEHTYWKHDAEWNARYAAMQGSSYYKLPRLLQWFTGNIGFHHLHHLKESTPNYRLEQVAILHPEYQDVYTVTLWSSLKSAFLSVWDEDEERLISFRALKKKIAAVSRSGSAWPEHFRHMARGALSATETGNVRKE
jgi:omega-6 fatty acid desaturase (delta-12 desaturase)